MLCTQRPPWISDPDISDNSPVFPSILIINSLGCEGSQPKSTAVHITWHGAQINFGDLPPYLTYGSKGETERNTESSGGQRVLNDLKRARFSLGRLIWLLTNPLPALQSVSSIDRKTEKERQVADGRLGERGWPRIRIIRPQESLVFYKSLNILCWRLFL
jgi:hypothetical protein